MQCALHEVITVSIRNILSDRFDIDVCFCRGVLNSTPGFHCVALTLGHI